MGLRWWSVIQPDGSEKWIFESRNTEFNVNKVDYYFFWASLGINFAFWAVFGIMNLLSFNLMWVISLLIAFCFNYQIANYKCYLPSFIRDQYALFL